MKQIQLTKGLFAIIDDEDFELISKYKWIAVKGRNTFYTQAKITVSGKRITLNMHRLITGAIKGEFVDHIDGNGLNNIKKNIRRCNRSQNGANQKGRGVSNYRGVSFRNRIRNNKQYSHWIASIQINGKLKHIGEFKSEKEAALAYNEKAKEVHGEFAFINAIN